MFRWNAFPFVRYSITLILGIMLGAKYPVLIHPIQLALLFIGGFFLYSLLVYWNGKFNQLTPWVGSMGLIIVVALGFASKVLNTECLQTDHLVHTGAITAYRGNVRSVNVNGERAQMECNVFSVYEQGTWKEVGGSVLLLLRDTLLDFQYGDEILVQGSPSRIKPPNNPNEFDYSNYMAGRNIYHQHFVGINSIALVSRTNAFSIRALAGQLRERMIETISQHVLGKNEKAVAIAILLGDKTELDNELVNSFSGTGTLHILAVSGLHVGIVFAIAQALLSSIRRFQSRRWITPIVVCFILWSYALVSGLTPSVVRASFMFSLVLIARAVRRDASIYNTIGLTVFVLLLINPNFLFQVGFQLSFMAVISIVFLYERILLLWQPPGLVLTYGWRMVSLTLSAQVGVLVPSLFYFHQFPTYFIIANLLAVPLAFVIVVLSIAVVISGVIPIISNGVGYLLSFGIKILLWWVGMIEALPLSRIDNIAFDIAEAFILLVGIVLFCFFLHGKSFSYWLSLTVASMLFGALQFARADYATVPEVVVYDIPGHYAIDLFHPDSVYFISDLDSVADNRKVSFHIDGYRRERQTKATMPADSMAFVRNLNGCRLAVYEGVKILQILEKDFAFDPGIQIDVLILSRDAIHELDELEGKVSFGCLVVDSSNSYRTAYNLKRISIPPGIPVHAVRLDGFFSYKKKDT